MSARDDVLAALRRAAPREVPPPDLASLGMRFEDPAARFVEAVARQVASLVPALAPGNVDLAAAAAPHALAALDLAILPGELAVAENGAVWVDAAALKHPAIFVIPEHLVLFVDARSVVADLHAAYDRLASRPARYGVFIAGPSKTADIEQALVIGAHGPRSSTVLLVG